MSDKVYNVLFICTGNSARSILAEGLLNHLGRGRFVAHSAGSQPSGTVNPFALSTLQALRIPCDSMRSKNLDEFATLLHRRSISSPPSATTPLARCARSGPASR